MKSISLKLLFDCLHTFPMKTMVDVLLHLAEIQILILADAPKWIHFDVFAEALGNNGIPLLGFGAGAEV